MESVVIANLEGFAGRWPVEERMISANITKVTGQLNKTGRTPQLFELACHLPQQLEYFLFYKLLAQ